jgi:acyl-CoA thioester hydrolase
MRPLDVREWSVPGFRYAVPMTVRFRDIDAFNHVNNAVISTYMEFARASYLMARLEVHRLPDLPVVVAHLCADFHSPADYGDHLLIACRVTRIGRKSFAMEYEIREEDGRRVATGESVQVWYDHATRTSQFVPERFVAAVEEYEGRSLRRT